MPAGETDAVHRLGAGGDVFGGEMGLVGIDGEQAGDAGDGVAVAPGDVLGRLAHRRQGSAQGVHDHVAGVAGQLAEQIGGAGVGFHAGGI